MSYIAYLAFSNNIAIYFSLIIGTSIGAIHSLHKRVSDHKGTG